MNILLVHQTSTTFFLVNLITLRRSKPVLQLRQTQNGNGSVGGGAATPPADATGDGDGGDGSLTATVISTSPVPEPGALLLVISGASLMVTRRFLKQNQVQ